MEKSQRYKYEAFVRVSDFGAAHREQFPESSATGELFARVSKAVAAIDEHMKHRMLARISRGVKTTTREAALKYMHALAKAGRQVTRKERDANPNPFRLQRQRTLIGDVTTARTFIEEATKRQEQFIKAGLPPTFISDFTALVDTLQEAVDLRLASKRVRGQAQAGIEAALADGLDAIHSLDVVITLASSQDPVLAAEWRSARRIEGQTPQAHVPPTPVPEPKPKPETAGPSVAPATPAPEPVAPTSAPTAVLAKAS